MRLCVVDLEMNKPSRKIIQISAVCLDVKSGKMGAKDFNLFVNPGEPLDPFIIELCGITDKKLKDQGVELSQALTDFWTWAKAAGCAKNTSAWGNDISIVIKQSRELGIRCEYPKILDIKEMSTILRCAYPNNKAKGGLLNTMNLFGLPFDGRQHDALCDAKNTAKLLYHFKVITEKYVQMNALLK